MSKIAIIGAGGHAQVVLDALLLSIANSEDQVVGWILGDAEKVGQMIGGFPVLGVDTDLPRLIADNAIDSFVMGLGMIVGGNPIRLSLFQAGLDAGLAAITVIHPNAVVAKSVTLGAGSTVMAGAIINPGTAIGRNTIINTGAVIEHDCEIADHVHIGPKAALSGGVHVGENTIVGVGATCLQGVSIGCGATIGAGSVIIRTVGDGECVVGNPARPIIRENTK